MASFYETDALVKLLNTLVSPGWTVNQYAHVIVSPRLDNPEKFVIEHFPYWMWDGLVVRPSDILIRNRVSYGLLKFLESGEAVPPIVITPSEFKKLNEQVYSITKGTMRLET